MKLKLITILLMTSLLAGCAQGKNTGDNMNQDSNIQEKTTFEAPVGLGAGEGANSVSESETTTEQQAYVLTFEANTIGGEAVTSDCFSQSKLTMINVWATYCNPCLVEMPDLGEIATSYDKADFQLIGIISDVAEDAGEADIQYAKDLISQTGANYPHLLLNESLYANLVAVVDSVPTTFFINQKGEVLGYVIGAQSKEVWEGVINDLLAEIE